MDIQIYIQNRKMNVENYITNLKESILTQNNEKFKKFLSDYLIDIKEKLNNEKIYITKYYVILSMEQKNMNIEEIDLTFQKLNKLGCVVNRLIGKQNIEKLLYESFHKECLI
ncbi:MAG: hypothetical protein Q4D02_00860 [Clostridia bacterium]|nr:hypothetical protein [Clostridia bacterium]